MAQYSIWKIPNWGLEQTVLFLIYETGKLFNNFGKKQSPAIILIDYNLVCK